MMRQWGRAYVSAAAVVEGDVVLGADASVWHFAVLRGDVAPLRIGARTNVQDGAVVHARTGVAVEIGEEVAIGHQALVHCRRVGPRTLVGSRAVLLDDVVVGEDCLIAACALVPPGTRIPPGSVVMGIPGRVVRAIRDEERAYLRDVVAGYVRLAQRHLRGEFPPLPGEGSL